MSRNESRALDILELFEEAQARSRHQTAYGELPYLTRARKKRQSKLLSVAERNALYYRRRRPGCTKPYAPKKRYSSEEARQLARRAYQAEYYRVNRQKLLAEKRFYTAQVKAQKVEYDRKRRAQLKVQIAAEKKAYATKNRERLAAYHRTYRARRAAAGNPVRPNRMAA